MKKMLLYQLSLSDDPNYILLPYDKILKIQIKTKKSPLPFRKVEKNPNPPCRLKAMVKNTIGKIKHVN